MARSYSGVRKHSFQRNCRSPPKSVEPGRRQTYCMRSPSNDRLNGSIGRGADEDRRDREGAQLEPANVRFGR